MASSVSEKSRVTLWEKPPRRGSEEIIAWWTARKGMAASRSKGS